MPELGVPADDEQAEQQARTAASRVWVTSRMRRLRKRSAISPAHGASSRKGRNCRPVTMPSAVDEWSVSTVRTSQSWRDPAHPGADVGDERAGRLDAVVADLERGEGGAHSLATRSRMAEAWRRTSCSSGGEVARAARTSTASRLRRMSLSRVRRLAGERQDHLAAVGGVVGARDEAALDEARRRCGSCSGALTFSMLGELARACGAPPRGGRAPRTGAAQRHAVLSNRTRREMRMQARRSSLASRRHEPRTGVRAGSVRRRAVEGRTGGGGAMCRLLGSDT